MGGVCARRGVAWQWRGVAWQWRACVAGTHCHAMGNALFSFPLQKTGHSRRFGRFTHGALSYQDPTPPTAPSVLGWGPPPCYKGQRAEAGQGWIASCQPQNRVPVNPTRNSQCPPCIWSAPGPAALLAQGLPDSCGQVWESDALAVQAAAGHVLGCRGVVGVGGSSVAPHTP